MPPDTGPRQISWEATTRGGTIRPGQRGTPTDPPTPPDPEPPSGPGSSQQPNDFFSELKRRKVYRVGAAYVAVAFAALEGASMVFPTFGLGPGVYNALVLVCLLGFPVAVGLAWTFDVTGSGIERTAPLGGDGASRTPDRWVRLKAALVGGGFVAVVWMGARAWQPLTEPPTTDVPTEAPWLAVLPLADLSPGGDQGYLADGIQEAILHRLAQVRGINLTSKTSTLFFRGVPGAVAGDSLGVRYVAEGSVRTVPDSVLLTVQLIDALTDEHLWSEEWRTGFTLDGLFELQNAAARKVTASVKGTLAGESQLPREAPPTQNLEAYNEYLRGVYYVNQFTVEAWWQAIDHFERAVQIDPEFGLAHAWLASTLAYLNNYGGVTQGELFPRMREHAELALRYGSENDPRVVLAEITYLWPQDFAWEEARLTIERALELDPNHVDALWYLAEWHGLIAGNPERGLEAIQRAQRMDPFSPSVYTVRMYILMSAGRFEEALPDLQALRAMDPSNLDALKGLITCLGLMGRLDEARPLVEDLLTRHPRPYPPAVAAHVARAGATDEAWEILRAAVARKEGGGSVAASGIAAAYAALGEVDQALDWLERSFREEGGVYYLRSYDFAPLAGEPRFQALWDQVGLYGQHWALDQEAAAGG